MKEPYGEDVANRTGLKPCMYARKDVHEASVEARAGWVSSPERNVVLGADAFPPCGRQHLVGRKREPHEDPAGSKAPRMHGTILRENREIPRLPAVNGTAGRMGKPKGTSP